MCLRAWCCPLIRDHEMYSLFWTSVVAFTTLLKSLHFSLFHHRERHYFQGEL